MSSLQPVPFDPLAVENVGVTLAVELLSQPLHPLPPPESFLGAGIYALYYHGNHEAYAKLKELEIEAPGGGIPLYVGKAVRENVKQGFNPRPSNEEKIFERLEQHAESIAQCSDLELSDFRCRFLILNDAYITLAEAVMITTFRPPWNGMGLGSRVVGAKRENQRPAAWDCLHPGRAGRPAGTEKGAEKARRQIERSIKLLQVPPEDERTRRMIEKIRRFLEGST